jgi:hypothetical protein
VTVAEPEEAARLSRSSLEATRIQNRLAWLRCSVTPTRASLAEGLEDMFTVRRPGVDGRLAIALTNNN